MSKYFSRTNNAFYDSDIVALDQMPIDVVLVSDSQYNSLLSQQLNGYIITSDADGNPIAQAQTVTPATSTNHELAVATTTDLGHIKVGTNLTVETDGTLNASDSGVVSIKGYAEETFRQGNVILTPANLGAAPASHGEHIPEGGN